MEPRDGRSEDGEEHAEEWREQRARLLDVALRLSLCAALATESTESLAELCDALRGAERANWPEELRDVVHEASESIAAAMDAEAARTPLLDFARESMARALKLVDAQGRVARGGVGQAELAAAVVRALASRPEPEPIHEPEPICAERMPEPDPEAEPEREPVTVPECANTPLPEPAAALAEPVSEGQAMASAPDAATDFVLLPANEPDPHAAPTLDLDAELLAEFLDESRDHLGKAEQALLALEGHPEDRAAIDTVFRAFHTIKGVAASLDMRALTKVAHVSESLLSRARDGKIRITGGYAMLAFRSVDMLRRLCEQVAAKGVDDPGILTRDPEVKQLLELLTDPEKHGIGEAAPGAGVAPPPVQEAPPVESAGKAREEDKQGDLFVRVRTDRLDRLLNAVGELVIAQSMVAQDDVLVGPQRMDLQRKVAHAGKIVRELQDLATSLRMVPLRATFKKMERTVRDVAQKTHKMVDFETDGEDTELDRNLVDVLAEPLVHMLRNAVDHGIERPADRRAVGKSERGCVLLRAEHKAGHVVVELKDDGRGLDRDKILAKAVSNGLVGPESVLDDEEVFQLIFAPGFSTAEKVTDVSGRGVGMDVVQRAIDELDGRISIRSELGNGTTFSIRLPLTLAITDGMLVRVGTERFIIPTLAITQSYRPQASALSRVMDRGEMLMFRGRPIPIFRIARAFGIASATDDPSVGLFVVIGDGAELCALLVDELLGQQQVVVKALGPGLHAVEGVSGGAILRDGRVGLILDPAGITRMAKAGHGRLEGGVGTVGIANFTEF